MAKKGQKERTPTPQIFGEVSGKTCPAAETTETLEKGWAHIKITHPKQGEKLKQVLPYNITLATSLWTVSQGLGKVFRRLPARLTSNLCQTLTREM